MSTSNPVIQLAASSVYVTTNLMLSPGFHWCLYVTDKDGYATRHHWAQGLTGIEQYKSNLIDPVTTYSTNSAVLAYLKIGGCLYYLTSFPDTKGNEIESPSLWLT
jgi:hypothetical protein